MASMAGRETMVKRPNLKDMGEDTDDCISGHLATPFIARGYLSKLNTKGKWQRRWWELRGPYLMYWSSESASRPKRKAPLDSVSMPDAAIDLRAIPTLFLDGTEMAMHSRSGREFRLKASSTADEVHMKDWQTALRATIDKFASGYYAGMDAEVVMHSSEEADDSGPGSDYAHSAFKVAGASDAPQADGMVADAAAQQMASLTMDGEGKEAGGAPSEQDEAPEDHVVLKGVWPADFEVQVMIGEMEKKKHPTYQVCVYKNGDKTSAVPGEGCVKRFGAWRDLNQLLVDKFRTQIPCEFPPTLQQSMWGLSSVQIQTRRDKLNQWLQSAVETPMPMKAAEAIAKFINVTDQVLNPTTQYSSLKEMASS